MPFYFVSPSPAITKDPGKVIEIAKARGFFTGSRAFGLDTENSDYDYVIPYKH